MCIWNYNFIINRYMPTTIVMLFSTPSFHFKILCYLKKKKWDNTFDFLIKYALSQKIVIHHILLKFKKYFVDFVTYNQLVRACRVVSWRKIVTCHNFTPILLFQTYDIYQTVQNTRFYFLEYHQIHLIIGHFQIFSPIPVPVPENKI